MKQGIYQEIKSKIRPGDIIAFGGRGLISSVIKWKTRSPVSHVGIMARNPKIVESTTLTEESGVLSRKLSERISKYDGEIWWLPLREDVRDRLNIKKMYEFLMDQVGKAYDTKQAILSALIWWTPEDDKSFFCSELCARAWEHGGIWSGNASEMTPADIVNEDLYQDIVQIHGEPKSIYM